MRIAYATAYDARSPVSWSGTEYFMWNALQGDGVEVDLIGPLDQPLPQLWKGKAWLYRRVLHSRYQIERQPWLQRHYARQVSARLEAGNYDLVLSPGTIPIAYLETSKPVVYWTDATFAGMIDFYPSFTNLARETIRDGNAGEQAALERCSLAIYASEWAAGTARQHYRVDPSKLRVVPLGANLRREPTAEEVAVAIAGRPTDECRLLFVAVEWDRKGGDTAVRVTGELLRRGIDATLTVVGVAPPSHSPSFVRFAGFIDKRHPAEAERYEALLKDSHFLIVPSRAEAYGLVYAEASAFGVPSLALQVGGVPTVVRDGANGKLFEPDADPSDYADFIARLTALPGAYRSLASSAHDEFRTRLNWRVAGGAVRSMLSELLRRR